MFFYFGLCGFKICGTKKNQNHKRNKQINRRLNTKKKKKKKASILRTQLSRTNTNTTKQNWRAERRENRQSTHQHTRAPAPTTTKLWTPISAAGISMETATATKETRRPAHKQQQHTTKGELSRPDSSRFFLNWTKFFLAFLWLFIDFFFCFGCADLPHRALVKRLAIFMGAFFMWLFIGLFVFSFFFLSLFPRVNVFFGCVDVPRLLLKRVAIFFGHFCVSLFLE